MAVAEAKARGNNLITLLGPECVRSRGATCLGALAVTTISPRLPVGCTLIATTPVMASIYVAPPSSLPAPLTSNLTHGCASGTVVPLASTTSATMKLTSSGSISSFFFCAFTATRTGSPGRPQFIPHGPRSLVRNSHQRSILIGNIIPNRWRMLQARPGEAFFAEQVVVVGFLTGLTEFGVNPSVETMLNCHITVRWIFLLKSSLLLQNRRRLVKRRRALLESNSPRNSQPETHRNDGPGSGL